MKHEVKKYKRKPFKFTGNAGDYFCIWIVNILLTVLTLGIYSAWAKVRTHQYFYSNTQLDGSTFQYLAKPMQILKSRLIAVALFVLYYALSSLYPTAAMGLLAIIILLIPAVIVLSMSFRMRHTAYRNVTFGFNQNFKRAYFIFAGPVLVAALLFAFTAYMSPLIEEQSLAALVAMLAFILIIISSFPFWDFLCTKFLVDHSKFGTSPFIFDAKASEFYKLYGSVILIFIIIGALASAVIFAYSGLKPSFNILDSAMMLMITFSVGIIPFYLWVFLYIQTKKYNLIYNHALLDPELSATSFESRLTVTHLFYLYLTNTLAIILSFSLLTPWAMVRMARYRAETMTLLTQTNLNNFTAEQQKKVSALGEEFGEVFNIEVGI